VSLAGMYIEKSLELLHRVRETQLEPIERGWLATECAELDAREEQALAEEGMGGERAAGPKY